jgi:hypothetical protein
MQRYGVLYTAVDEALLNKMLIQLIVKADSGLPELMANTDTHPALQFPISGIILAIE